MAIFPFIGTIPQLLLIRAMKTLRTKNVFSTLMEQLKAIGSYPPLHEPNNIVDPANANMGSPVILLVGGGMGAGKSSVVKDAVKW